MAGIGLMSLAVHGVLIGAAVYGTLGATEAKTTRGLDTSRVHLDTTMLYMDPPHDDEPKAPAPPVMQFDDIRPGLVPPDISGIPGTDPQRIFDNVYEASAGDSAVRMGQGWPDWVYPVEIVEQRPEALSLVSPEYPPLLRQANIEGTVVVEFVIDTMGLVEPHSITVVRSANPAFERPVLGSLTRALFRPARMQGRAVRVRAAMTILFRTR